MHARRTFAPLLLLAVSLGIGACGGGPEGAMDDIEEEVEGAEWGPDTAGPGPQKGMGAGSIADTLERNQPGIEEPRP